MQLDEVQRNFANSPFCDIDFYTCEHFCYKVVYCWIWDRCIIGIVQQVYYITLDIETSAPKQCKPKSLYHKPWQSAAIPVLSHSILVNIRVLNWSPFYIKWYYIALNVPMLSPKTVVTLEIQNVFSFSFDSHRLGILKGISMKFYTNCTRQSLGITFLSQHEMSFFSTRKGFHFFRDMWSNSISLKTTFDVSCAPYLVWLKLAALHYKAFQSI